MTEGALKGNGAAQGGKEMTMIQILGIAVEESLKQIDLLAAKNGTKKDQNQTVTGGNLSIIFTGHSLGGAAAALMAYDTAYELKQNDPTEQIQEKAGRLYEAVKDKRLKDTVRLYTFGQPVVFAVPFKHDHPMDLLIKDYWRVTNQVILSPII